MSQGTGKGLHTTTSRELILLPGQGMLIDNPGIREIALWEEEGETDAAFQDIAALARDCRFRDCTHQSEPGCRVREAVASGELEARRLESFLKVRREMDFLARRQDCGAERLEKERWRSIHRSVRTMKKVRDKY
jgi:ribosome biogenesis GTPase